MSGCLKQINDIHWAVVQQGREVEKVRSSLEQIETWLGELLAKRLKSVDLQRQVQQLLTEVCSSLALLRQIGTVRSSCWQRLALWRSVLCQALCGPSEVQRSLEKARQELELELRSIADKVSGDSFDICQHSIPFPLPTTYVRPATTADQLHDMLAAFAGPQQQQQHQPPPTVFQLLGMPGIGKSTLALIVAKELEDQGEKSEHGSNGSLA